MVDRRTVADQWRIHQCAIFVFDHDVPGPVAIHQVAAISIDPLLRRLLQVDGCRVRTHTLIFELLMVELLIVELARISKIVVTKALRGVSSGFDWN